MKFPVITFLLILTAFQAKAQLHYPSAKEIDVTDSYHGIEIRRMYSEVTEDCYSL